MDLSDGVWDDESFLGLGFSLLVLIATAAVFIAVSFGGGGVAVSLSLLLSGLKILFVLTNFFWASFLIEDFAAGFWACFRAGMFFLFVGFDIGFTIFVIGVIVAEALGFVWGLRFDFVSSDSEE